MHFLVEVSIIVLKYLGVNNNELNVQNSLAVAITRSTVSANEVK